jgi:hypothetical protein
VVKMSTASTPKMAPTYSASTGIRDQRRASAGD